jgi:uncharacterized repeat protein (TIGR01451 family)
VDVERLARWLILIALTCVALTLTAALIAAASPADAQPADPKVRQADPSTPSPQSLVKLEPDLAKAMATAGPDERLNIIVEMREQVEVSALAASQPTSANAREHMVTTMQSVARRSQATVRAYLSARWLTGDVKTVTPFWIFNGLAVNGARPDVVQDLAAHPDVALIRLDHWRRWIEEQPGRLSSVFHLPSSAEWGIERIRATEVWNSLGVDGTGVVIANIDTGVDWQHPALQPTYRGYDPKGFHQHEGNWHDATEEGALYPVDGQGHGSHTMGSIVGQGGIGVAPGARWIAVRGFNSEGFALDSWLHAAFEWLLAPSGNPELAPHVVSNSWGNSLSGLTTFQHDIDALRAAGIFTLFAAGNFGANSGSIGSPASLPGAFAVGASDPDDEVADFSSRGPSPWGKVRPHVVAPGVNVRSTLPGGAYGEKQGTSMATPHAAGTAALMLSVKPDMTITQTSFFLTSTAVPLSDVVPNNDSGYGRIDAYAAVALAADAGLISGTVYGDSAPLATATVQATPAITGLEGYATSDSHGRYRLFLGRGYYDLTARAFGHAPDRAEALSVTTGAVTTHDFHLVPLATGRVQGTVKTPDGEGVKATISVLDTPVVTDSLGGNYRLDLPAGQYTLEARALGHRVVTASVTVIADQNTSHDFVLPDSMRILLVDSGSWYYESYASYYRQALDDLAYAYDEHRLKHLPDDTPTVTDLLSYDLVIWSAPNDSPGAVDAGTSIYKYLEHGGNLLLSGQDVAFFDGGGILNAQAYYMDLLHSRLRNDNAPSREVVCLEDSAVGAINLTIQGGDGADNQRWPDEIAVMDPDYASLACKYDGGQGAVIQAGFCSEYRGLSLGFGLEGISNAADRAQFMARALDWFASPRQTAGVEFLPQTAPIQVAPPGEIVTHTFRLRNLAEVGAVDQFQVEISGDEWPVTISQPTVNISPCGTTNIDVWVEIPAKVTWNALDVLTVTARSFAAPSLSQILTVTSKAPAPVLLVDDDRWFDQAPIYDDALSASDFPYDRWEVTGFFGEGSPTPKMLSWYPAVVWFTGYDWYDPIHESEVAGLVNYLEGGGRLLLSSQSALSYVGNSELAVEYFGVISFSRALSHTTVWGVPGSTMGDGIGPVNLDYPFPNWSDSLLPSPGTQIALRGQHGQPGAVTRESVCRDSDPNCRWRAALFAFPFEALPRATRLTLMSRLVGWLSWLGGSEFSAGQAVAGIGDTIDYSLTLRNDGPASVLGATVSNTLPAGTILGDGPHGGAHYDPLSRRVSWSGDLAPGGAVTLSYQLELTSGVGDGPVRNTADVVLNEQGLAFQREAIVRIAAPDLGDSYLILSHKNAPQSPTAVTASSELTATLVVRNNGLADAAGASVDHPLPWPLRLITGTLSVQGGGTTTELARDNRVLWEGKATVGAPVTLTYRATAPALLGGALWLYDAARLEDGLGGAWERGAWLYVQPHHFYMPIFFKGG